MRDYYLALLTLEKSYLPLYMCMYEHCLSSIVYVFVIVWYLYLGVNISMIVCYCRLLKKLHIVFHKMAVMLKKLVSSLM